MTLIATARCLMAVLQPLMGTRSSGTATVKATGADALLPANAYGVPIVSGEMRHDLLLRVDANPAAPTPPATVQGDWTVDALGTAVAITSLLGGIDVNLPAGTEIRWWPSLPGVEPKSVLATPLIGGTKQTGIASLAQVVFFEQLRANLSGAAEDLFKSLTSRFPAAVLVWDGIGPADGSSISALDRGSARVGTGNALYAYTWDLFVVTSRADSDPARREEGLTLVDVIMETIQDRHAVDGVRFSNPAGVQIRDVRRWLVAPAFYVYLLRLATASNIKTRDPRTWNPWLLTRLDVDTPDGAPQGPLPMIDDNRFPMPT